MAHTLEIDEVPIHLDPRESRARNDFPFLHLSSVVFALAPGSRPNLRRGPHMPRNRSAASGSRRFAPCRRMTSGFARPRIRGHFRGPARPGLGPAGKLMGSELYHADAFEELPEPSSKRLSKHHTIAASHWYFSRGASKWKSFSIASPGLVRPDPGIRGAAAHIDRLWHDAGEARTRSRCRRQGDGSRSAVGQGVAGEDPS